MWYKSKDGKRPTSTLSSDYLSLTVSWLRRLFALNKYEQIDIKFRLKGVLNSKRKNLILLREAIELKVRHYLPVHCRQDATLSDDVLKSNDYEIDSLHRYPHRRDLHETVLKSLHPGENG